MNDLQIFNNDEFGQVRVIEIDGEPWFVGKDVAIMLGYRNPREALKRHVNDADKGVVKHDSLGGLQNIVIINESGLYSLILASKLPKAKEVTRWITSEVMPSIRKHGMYATPEFIEKSFEDPEYVTKALQALHEAQMKNKELTEAVEVRDKTIAKLEPKANYYDRVLACKDTVPITVIAKDYGWSARRMNKYLKELGVQYKRGDLWVLYQDFAPKCWAVYDRRPIEDKSGSDHSRKHLRWTNRGWIGIYDLLKEHGILPLIEQEYRDDERKN